MLRLKIIDSISHAAKTVNEDLFDHNDQAAWIFDGATGIAKNTIPDAASDPQWLVQTVNEELKRVWDDKLPTRDLLLKAAENTIDRCETVMDGALPRLAERPTACFTMVRLWNDQLEISSVGDAGVIFETNEQIKTFGCIVYPAAAAVRKERKRLLEIGTPPQQLMSSMLPLHEDFRAKANIDGGYDILDTTTRWVDRISIQLFSIEPRNRLLLLTDGLYRLIDTFMQYDAASLIEAAEKKSLTALYDELRDIELLDQACSEFPRAKIHDDVAAALISIV